MKQKYVRNKRMTSDSIDPLVISLEKQAAKKSSGILQAVINILVYFVIFVFVLKTNIQYMGMFIGFMAASVIAQVFLRFAGCFRRSHRFPFVEFVREKDLYSDYLRRPEAEISAYMQKYEQHLEENLLSVKELQRAAEYAKPPLYSRLPEHKDFLTLNLGTSCGAYPIAVQYPHLTYQENDPKLERFRARMEKRIANGSRPMPCGFPLRSGKSLALTGKGVPQEQFSSIVNACILDLAVMHSPEELAITCVFSPESNLYWTRFLPHVWHANRRLLFCGSESADAYTELIAEAIAEKHKHVVAIVDVDFANEQPFYGMFNNPDLPENLSVLFFSHSGVTPSRAAHQITCTERRGKCEGDLDGERILMQKADALECARTARKLFNTELVDNRTVADSSIPERVAFFNLFDVRSAHGLPRAAQEDCANIHRHMPVRVGVGKNGRDVYIDLTNDGDGNHCLVTGTTGSGKSEFMLSFVQAACAQYPPDYLSFVVIDFKGGSMSSKIKELPHCLGEFTNHSGMPSPREITRIATLLESELSYRESVLREHSCSDLDAYHHLYAQGKVEVPIPRLLIVIDEVAIFFNQDTAAAQYISHIATAGRFVGMVLLIATQSPSGVIPSQVSTNVNVSVEFYSNDSSSQERIKGRAKINSHLRSDYPCQMALSSVYEISSAAVDFLTLSGASRLTRSSARKSQFDLTCEEIHRRYPTGKYLPILNEVLTPMLEERIPDGLTLDELQQLYYGNPKNSRASFPVGISDNFYDRKRQAFFYTPGAYNMAVYGRPQSGKTTLCKSVVAALCNEEHGLRPNELGVYIAASNPEEYSAYRFPQVAGILDAKNIYYLLLFLRREIRRRESAPNPAALPHMVVILDGCINAIEGSEELIAMLTEITAVSVKNRISIILTLSGKTIYCSSALKNCSAAVAFYMGDDYEYSPLMHIDKIKRFPEIRGRCLTAVKECSERTMETQIAFPYEQDEKEILAQVEDCNALWMNRPRPAPVPLMPARVSMPFEAGSSRVPVGISKNLVPVYWNTAHANSQLVSFTSYGDAASFVMYLIRYFGRMEYNVIVMDNMRGDLKASESMDFVEYFAPGAEAALEERLRGIVKPESGHAKTALVMFEFVTCLVPADWTVKPLLQMVDTLVRTEAVCGVFADFVQALRRGRGASVPFVPYLEGKSSGVLIGGEPSNHDFGASGLSLQEQNRPMDVGWGVNVSQYASEVVRMKLASEVRE